MLPSPPPRTVGFLLSSVGAAVAHGFRAALEPLELAPRQFAVLRSVVAEPGQSQQALCARANIPASRMVAVIDRLEERGLLERRQNPSDRRARAVYITPRGGETFGQAVQLAASFEQRVCAGLSAAEREELIDTLLGLSENLGFAEGEHAAERLGGVFDD
ncbi:MAG TPA: MarR family transcriptional regulator [Solirubrobacteraceae bacterium]|jgi:DNA-binding MarR family transcriptional regulator|nr:MarR family transcriptional regulator [Solirubrobacteraceae bacterium]